MSVVRSLLAGLLLWLALMVPAFSGATTDDEAVLRELKQVLWPQAYRQQDVALLDRILADSFQMIDGDGAWSDKAGELKWVAANKLSHDTFRYEIQRLDIYNGDTAIIAGKGVMTGTDAKGPYEAEYQSSNVLVKQDGQWRAVASHVSGYKRK